MVKNPVLVSLAGEKFFKKLKYFHKIWTIDQAGDKIKEKRKKKFVGSEIGQKMSKITHFTNEDDTEYPGTGD